MIETGKIYNEDCLDTMAHMDDDSVDLIVTDPPYGVSYKTNGDLKAQYGKKYEMIIYANKGRSEINGKRLTDVWHFDRVSGDNQEHQNQKPVQLISQIIDKSSNENDLVYDPFMGSGTTAVVCERLNRQWIGSELSEDYCKIARERIKIEQDQGKLF